MRCRCVLAGLLLVMTALSFRAGAQEALLIHFREAPQDNVAVIRADLGPVFPAASGPAPTLTAVPDPDRGSPPLQFVPDVDFGLHGHAWGTVIVQTSPGEARDIAVTLAAPPEPSALVNSEAIGGGAVLGFTLGRPSGLPSRILFSASGKSLDTFDWNDRVHDSDLGGFWLRHDPKPGVAVVSDGPLCTVVRVRAAYCAADGTRPPSAPEAVYDWYVFKESPLVWVRAAVTQNAVHDWEELHFLEFNYPDDSFPAYSGANPLTETPFVGNESTTVFDAWAALVDAPNALALLDGPARIYDGKGYGRYIHSTWRSWDTLDTTASAWLWLGASDALPASIEAALKQKREPHALLTRASLRAYITSMRQQPAETEEARRTREWFALSAERLEEAGEFLTAMQLAQGKLPASWKHLASGDLRMTLEQVKGGLALRSLYDTKTGTELLARTSKPLFEIDMAHVESGEQVKLRADQGWSSVDVITLPEHGTRIVWSNPGDARLKEISVSAMLTADERTSAWNWNLGAGNTSADWSIEHVTFPQLDLADLSAGSAALFPRGPGELRANPCAEPFAFSGTYPNGWCSMQFMALYRDNDTGLYMGFHDPRGSVKDLNIASDPANSCLAMSFTTPAPDATRPGNSYAMGGEAVWALVRGDWYDAARRYRDWAKLDAEWWPALSDLGRPDTPQWMRELPAWAMTGGAPGECVQAVKDHAAFLGVPVGFHWYNWHQIPFDNDYPHYFPTKEGFVEGVKELKDAGVRVMPYINGRLWDTRDKGQQDREYTSLALPAATKDRDDKPHTEKYGSKEADGSPVELAVMCPTATLWQDTVKETVLRLQKECRVDGVYIDQVAAASPRECMDKTHGHPLGGGSWWNAGYWTMLEGIRSAQPAQTMLTTECNADPFIRWFDGYLTWHWQYDGQVPAFPAVYGGTIQMFGRAYGGGPTRDLALRMKAGQQLTFGEQIGWLAPALLDESDSKNYYREVVRLRWRLRHYFYAGEMMRPPKLEGTIPTVRADWQWSGEWWVTTSAVMTAAWRRLEEPSLVMVFTNVSDEPVTAHIRFDGAAYGLEAGGIPVKYVTGDSESTLEGVETPSFERDIEFPARSVFAWEMACPRVPPDEEEEEF